MVYARPPQPPSSAGRGPGLVKSWNSSMVARWLDDNQFGFLTDNFLANDVDGATLLALTNSELIEDLNVQSLGQRKKLLERVSHLRTSGSGSPYVQSIYTGRKPAHSPYAPKPRPPPRASPRSGNLRIPHRNVDGSYGASRPSTARTAREAPTPRGDSTGARRVVHHGGWAETLGSGQDGARTARPSTRVAYRGGGSRPSSAGSRGSCGGSVSRISPHTNRVAAPGSYRGRDDSLRDKTVMIFGDVHAEELQMNTRGVGYRTEVSNDPGRVLDVLRDNAKIHTIVLCCEHDSAARGEGALEMLIHLRGGPDKPRIPVVLCPEDESEEMNEIVGNCMRYGPCLLLSNPSDQNAIRQTMQVCAMMRGGGNTARISPIKSNCYSPPSTARSRGRPATAGSCRKAQLSTNPIMASITPRYTNGALPPQGLSEAQEEERAKEEEELEDEISKAPVAAISGYNGHIPGVRTMTYGRVFPRNVKEGPKKIVPGFVDPEEMSVHPNLQYPAGTETNYARDMRCNVRNRGSIVFGDDRINNLETSYLEFYEDLRDDKPKSQMMVHIESLPTDRLDQLYKNAERKIGKAMLDKWEISMRDKVTMYTSGGPGGIRKQFKYFDRDASGSVDFDEFKFALDTFGMNLNEDQLLAFFGRYDCDRTTEIGYKNFINQLLDEGSMFKDVQANMAANIAASILGGGEEDPDREPLTEEEKLEQKPIVEKMFLELDADGSGMLDMDEIKQLCMDLGLDLSEDEYGMVMEKIDEDKSGECDFDEFFEWYVKF